MQTDLPPAAAPLGTAEVSPSTEELLTAVRSLFACTRRMRTWVGDAGAATVLGVVADLGESRVSAIATAAHMDVSTVSRTLTALCKDGLVTSRADQADLRSHLTRCTPAGVERLADRRAAIAEQLDSRLADWDTDDVAQLSRLLNRFVDSVLSTPAPVSAPPIVKENS
jgi:DNA-binding MarR family transcriptional regulator